LLVLHSALYMPPHESGNSETEHQNESSSGFSDSKSAPHSHVAFGLYEFNLQTLELREGGLRLRIPHQSFQILAMLLERITGRLIPVAFLAFNLPSLGLTSPLAGLSGALCRFSHQSLPSGPHPKAPNRTRDNDCISASFRILSRTVTLRSDLGNSRRKRTTSSSLFLLVVIRDE